MHLQFITKPQNACDYYRIALPLDFYRQEEGDSMHMFWCVEDERKPDFMQADAIVFNRYIEADADSLVGIREVTGCKIVVDLDDYWHLNPEHQIYKPWNEGGLPERIEGYLKIADLVFVTNEQLKAKVLEFNKNVVVVPNAIPYDKGMFAVKPKPQSDKMRFIYAGGSTHARDVQILSSKFRRIGDDTSIREKAEFILAGYNPAAISVSDPWEQMAYVFSRTGSYKIIESSPLEIDDDNGYMNFYDEADVVLIPLVDNEFNQKKSILKIIEASAKGLPCIVSNVWPYKEVAQAPGILWVNEPNDWLKHIRFCVNNPLWVKEAGMELHYWMKARYDIREWNKVRFGELRKLVKK